MNKEADQPEGDGAERSDFTVQSGRDIVCPCFEVTADDFVALFASDPDI
ncbi:MAG: hypothetical protein HOH89_07920, partial [Alphaproteobacteria bacterium]|nr:hypothetical protein [Alphaproteobacteria bacterium]